MESFRLWLFLLESGRLDLDGFNALFRQHPDWVTLHNNGTNFGNAYVAGFGGGSWLVRKN